MIKAAVVGVGYLGRFHAEKYAKARNAELVALVDVVPDNARKLARKYRTQVVQDYKMLPELGVKCASIVSDTSTHFEIANWLLEHGVDVLVEKPVTTTVEEARQLIETADKNGRILQVGHLERFNPAFREMKRLLTRPWFFEVRRIAPFAGRGHDVDVVLDLMIHDVDIIAHLVDRPLVKVEAVGIPVLTGSIDIANARLTFEGGAVANVSASRAAFTAERTIRIFQPEVYISLDFGKKKLKIYTKSSKKDDKGFPKINIDERKVEERDALQDEIAAFLNSVENRDEPVVSGWDGLRALEMVQKIREALKESFESLDDDGALRLKAGNMAW